MTRDVGMLAVLMLLAALSAMIGAQSAVIPAEAHWTPNPLAQGGRRHNAIDSASDHARCDDGGQTGQTGLDPSEDASHAQLGDASGRRR